MAAVRMNIRAILLVGALAVAFVAGIAAPAPAGSLFGNRSRERQDSSIQSSSSTSRMSSPSITRERGTLRVESRSGTGITSVSRPSSGIRGGSIFDRLQSGVSMSIWSRSRLGGSEPAREPAQVRENSRNRGPSVDTGGGISDRLRNRSSSIFSSRESATRSTSAASVSTFTRSSDLFTRLKERTRTRIDSDPDYYRTYRRYYDGFWYRPHTGWHRPHYYGGFYYYSWPDPIEPCFYGYYVFGNVRSLACPSVYFHYGYFPYIHRSRVLVLTVPIIRYIEVPVTVRYRYDDDYYLSMPPRGSIDWTIKEIRDAWLKGDVDRIERYVDRDRRIHVYLDGKYAYSIEGRDYIDMTRDAMDRIDTVDLDFYSVRRRGDDAYVAYGVHTFREPDGSRNQVYVSYTFERIHGDWVLTEVGSSKSRLGDD